MKKKSDTSQRIDRLIKGKVGRSLMRSTVELATARSKIDNKREIVIESEQSSSSDQ